MSPGPQRRPSPPPLDRPRPPIALRRERPAWRRSSVGQNWLALVLAMLLGLFGCDRFEPADPLLGERLILVETAALSRLLERSAQLEGTPLARASDALTRHSQLAETSRCDTLWGRFDAGFEFDSALGAGADAGAESEHRPASGESDEARKPLGARVDALRCGEYGNVPGTEPDSAALRELASERRGKHQGLLVWPLGEDGGVELTFDIDANGGLRLQGHARPPSRPGALALLLPSEDEPAAPAIEPSSAFVHLRMRPAGGLRLSQLIPSGGQADRLFALRSRLLEGALLSGTWELAFVAPAAGGDLPLAVAALHHRLAGPVEQAVDEALDQIEATWPIQRTPRPFPLADGTAAAGGCYLDLPLLPELAPCWAITSDALVVGYREEALRRALAAPAVASAGAASEPPLPHGLEIHFDRLGRSRRAGSQAAATTRLQDVYSKLGLRVRRESDVRVAIQAELVARP